MHKIIYSIDGESKFQYAINGIGVLYASKDTAQHEANFLGCEIDEDGNAYVSPVDYWVEKATPHDFAVRRQGVVIRCRHCHGELDQDPFPLFSDLKRLIWNLVIDPEDFKHDAGCMFILLNHIPLPPDDPEIEG